MASTAPAHSATNGAHGSRELVTYEAEVVSAVNSGFLMPLGTPAQAQVAISAYEQLKEAIRRPEDIHIIQGRPFLKKSFWRRVATCFGLTLELVGEERLMLDGKLAYRVLYRAVAPNGRAMTADGMCSNAEPGHQSWPEHNIRATAHTRAKNRAISDLVGGGEVTAEEMGEEEQTQFQSDPQRAQRQPQRQVANGASTAPAEVSFDERLRVALKRSDILALLNTLGCRNDGKRRAKLTEVYGTLGTVGKEFNGANVTAELQRQIDLSHAAGPSDAVEFTVDAVPADELPRLDDLHDLDMGAPGN